MVSASHLTHGSDIDGTSSATTASVTPHAGRLQILAVRNRNASGGTMQTPTVSGCGITWVQIATFNASVDPNHRVTLFRASGSPTAGALTIDFAGVNQNSVEWSLEEFTNVDLSGSNGANAIVQNASGETASASTFSVALAALASSKNAAYGFAYQNAVQTLTKGANFTELSNIAFDGAGMFLAEWAINQTTPDFSSTGAGYWIGIAIELKNAEQNTLLGTL